MTGIVGDTTPTIAGFDQNLWMLEMSEPTWAIRIVSVI
jgi:hypothetical protein